MKLEVGIYVRTETGQIGKITNFDGAMARVDTDKFITYKDFNNEITKASHNIIDLIEVGDVIVDKDGHKYPINYEFEIDYNNEYQSYEITIDDNITLFFEDGLSIVTKEQFSAMEYKVGEE